MIYGVYTIRDQLVGYGSPTIAANDDVAIRHFNILVNGDSGSLVSETPQYFDLYKIGEFDDNTGEITSITPDLIITGLSVVKKESV